MTTSAAMPTRLSACFPHAGRWLRAAALGLAAGAGWFGPLAPARAEPPALEVPAAAVPDDPIDPAQVPEAVRGLAQANRLGTVLPLDIQFADSAGRRRTLGSFFGRAPGTPDAVAHDRPVVILMVYFRCPLVCQGMMHRLYAKLADLDLNPGEKYTLLVVSFDPTEGPAQAAKEKAAALASIKRTLPPGATESIEFLTDAGSSARTLADALGFPYRFLPESGEFAHGTAISIASPSGTLSRTLVGLEFPVATLRLALLEASAGKIGSTVDRIYSWCFHFDPHANAYVVQAFRVMQVGAVGGAVVLGGLMFALVWRERLRRARIAREAFARLNDPRVVTIDIRTVTARNQPSPSGA